MRISTVARDRYADHSNELAHMHRFRATGFRDYPERSVTTSEPIEFNHCDQLDSAYVRAVTNDKRAFGCAPHLSAVRPTILKPTCPQHSAEGSLNATDRMIESSQVCIDTSSRPCRGGPRFHVAILTMFASIIECSMADGCDQVLTANERPFERFLNCTGVRQRGEESQPRLTMAGTGEERGMTQLRSPTRLVRKLQDALRDQLCLEIMHNPDGWLFIERLGYRVDGAGVTRSAAVRPRLTKLKRVAIRRRRGLARWTTEY